MHLPESKDKDEIKLLFKLKGLAFDCLNYLFPHNSNESQSVLEHLNYIFDIEAKSESMTNYCLDYLHSFLNSKWWLNSGTSEDLIDPVLKRITEVAICNVYNFKKMLAKY
jgi:hypothetical protein